MSEGAKHQLVLRKISNYTGTRVAELPDEIKNSGVAAKLALRSAKPVTAPVDELQIRVKTPAQAARAERKRERRAIKKEARVHQQLVEAEKRQLLLLRLKKEREALEKNSTFAAFTVVRKKQSAKMAARGLLWDMREHLLRVDQIYCVSPAVPAWDDFKTLTVQKVRLKWPQALKRDLL